MAQEQLRNVPANGRRPTPDPVLSPAAPSAAPSAAVSDAASAAVLQALKAVLRPIARLLIARGVTLPAVVAALKEVLVEVAARDFRLGGKEASDSRVSLLTGVHRKDVRAIRAGAPPLSAPRPGGLGATVVGRWLAGRDTTDADGRPRPLPRQAAAGAPSFEALVAGVSTDLRPRTVLDELLRLGLVVHDEATDTVRLLAEGYVPAGGGAEVFGFFGRNLHDHLAAAVANLLAGPEERRFLERAVYYNALPPEAVDRLEAEARTLALAALRHLNSLALERQQAAAGEAAVVPEDGGARAPLERFRFGVFFYREPMADPAEPPPPPTAEEAA
jgi:hypothetical protein